MPTPTSRSRCFFAARRFDDPALHEEALTVLNALWQDDVTAIAGMNVLTAGNWANPASDTWAGHQPSYFAPYAYRTFAVEDPAQSVVQSHRQLVPTRRRVQQCRARTGRERSACRPNWCAISRATGRVVSFPTIANADDYGYDAFRVMWRVALDALWNDEPRARAYLEGSTFLRTAVEQPPSAGSRLRHDGSVVSSFDDPTIYGGDIGKLRGHRPFRAAQIEQLLLASFHPFVARVLR